MQQEATTKPCLASPPDPQPNRQQDNAPAPRAMPERIAALLHTLRIMLGFGRHLAATAPLRSTTPGFNPIAACFGTARLSAIMARLQRGLLLATALQNVLLARAARGRDIEFFQPRERSTAQTAAATPEAPADPTADHASAAAPPARPAEIPATRKAARAPSRPTGWDDPELFMPSLKELEAQVRRRSIGSTLVAICLDLAVLPSFCTGAYWNQLSEDIRLYGGNVAALMQEKFRREQEFSREQDRNPRANWDWVGLTRAATRHILGCFIGEAADDAFDLISQQYCPAAAAAPCPS